MEGRKILNAVCCFIGHRDVRKTADVQMRLKEIVKDLIENNEVTVYIFGSRSTFNQMAYEVVTELKRTYTDIERVYARAEYPSADDDYKEYLLTIYDDTYFALKSASCGKASYLERNKEMIDRSEICVFYYDSSYEPIKRGRGSKNSGTRLAYEYATKRRKRVINIFSESN